MTSKEQLKRIQDYKNTFSADYGKRVLDDLMLFCGGHTNQDNFDPQNERRTAYNLGKNRVYRYILSFVEYKEDELEKNTDCIMEGN